MSSILWLLALVSIVVGDENPCASWTAIEKKLKGKVSETSCKKNDKCTAMSCDLHEYGYDMHCGLQLNPCENPASMELEVDIPKLNINSWRRKFYHEDKFSLTGGFGGEVGLEKKNNEFILSLTVHFEEGNKLSSLLHLSDVQYPVFQNVVFPIQPCTQTTSVSTKLEHIVVTTVPSTKSPVEIYSSNIADISNCSIRNDSCAENEICKQIDKKSPDGICVCNFDYIRGRDGKCHYNPTSTTTVTPSSIPDHGNASNTSLLLVAILVPTTVITFIVGIVCAVIKFRICQHLRRRLRVQVYEHVLLGQDDDDDDDDVLANPVA